MQEGETHERAAPVEDVTGDLGENRILGSEQQAKTCGHQLEIAAQVEPVKDRPVAIGRAIQLAWAGSKVDRRAPQPVEEAAVDMKCLLQHLPHEAIRLHEAPSDSEVLTEAVLEPASVGVQI